MKRRWKYPVALVPLLGLSAPLYAQQEGASFEVTPYAWFAGLDGDVSTPGGVSIESDRDLEDVFDDVDTGLMLTGDGTWNRFGVLGEFSWLELESSSETPGTGFNGSRLETDVMVASLAPYFRIAQSEALNIDLLAGARWWQFDSELTLQGGVLPGQQASADEDWVEGIVGARARLNLTPQLFLMGYGDIGSGGDADETWQLYGVVGYQFNDNLSAQVGYRYLDASYEEDGFEYDIAADGLLAGVGFRF